MITFLTPERLKPPPVMPELEPTPMTVLFEATLYMPEIVINPEIRTVCDVLELSADLSADAEVTVTTVLDEPPVVPPFRLAKPTGLDSAAKAGPLWATTRPVPAARTPAVAAARTVRRDGDMGIPPSGNGSGRVGWGPNVQVSAFLGRN
ncbi:hypothetical protein Areg01_07810 [Actinoplanes regularis]|nr:hypothetical protein Areg01_07810 [Actinoplanes regularis]